MDEFLGIFQIGPVQEYVNCAKKTQDFWAGSYLLSFLNCIAIYEVEKSRGTIIYPSIDNQPIYEYVKDIKKNGKKPWECQPKGNQLIPTIPNRFVCKLFVCKLKERKKVLSDAEKEINQTFSEIVNLIKSKFEGEIDIDASLSYWNEIWDRQTKNFFEIYWIIQPFVSNKYKDSYKNAENFFASRKNVRNFENIEEPGYKCTLCGKYEPLTLEKGDSNLRKNIKSFWDKIRKKTGYRFREEEHLCAVCTVKRLLPEYIFGIKSAFPSTSYFAVSDFLYALIKKQDMQDKIKEFVDEVKNIRKELNLDFDVEPIPKLKKEANERFEKLIKLDGDWFIKDTYENIIAKKEIDDKQVKKIEEKLESLENLFKDKVRPYKYFAVFQMDGDDMGEKISQQESEESHKNFSKKICDFAVNSVPEIVEQNYLGKIIYFGGDEGVCFISLEDMLSVIEECRNKFAKTGCTASIGVVIAHHQQPLLQILAEVRKAVKRVKEMLDGKNGFCISIMKRSGGVSYGMAKWEYGNLKVIEVLKELVDIYKNDKISDRWFYQFSFEKFGLLETGSYEKINLVLAPPELERLIRRHKNEKITDSELDKIIINIKTLIEEIKIWDEFMGLMEVPIYIARGGGK